MATAPPPPLPIHTTRESASSPSPTSWAGDHNVFRQRINYVALIGIIIFGILMTGAILSCVWRRNRKNCLFAGHESHVLSDPPVRLGVNRGMNSSAEQRQRARDGAVRQGSWTTRTWTLPRYSRRASDDESAQLAPPAYCPSPKDGERTVVTAPPRALVTSRATLPA